jgi:flagellar basal-body rod protein FlgB
MADSLFHNTTDAVLAKVLDGAASRQRALADNIANADTPGYTRKDVSFEQELRLLISQEGTDVPSIRDAVDRVAIAVTDDTTSPRGIDGNNVVLEREMADLAKNSLQYETTAQLLSMKFRELRSAIREGR